ncbi:hypothetical protein X948_6276 [Burkholderia pseudomallei MSHR5608]|nr:hypothetical protein X948_6276 [Burkholderia pseudomallei MSHR5608]
MRDFDVRVAVVEVREPPLVVRVRRDVVAGLVRQRLAQLDVHRLHVAAERRIRAEFEAGRREPGPPVAQMQPEAAFVGGTARHPQPEQQEVRPPVLLLRVDHEPVLVAFVDDLLRDVLEIAARRERQQIGADRLRIVDVARLHVQRVAHDLLGHRRAVGADLDRRDANRLLRARVGGPIRFVLLGRQRVAREPRQRGDGGGLARSDRLVRVLKIGERLLAEVRLQQDVVRRQLLALLGDVLPDQDADHLLHHVGGRR